MCSSSFDQDRYRLALANAEAAVASSHAQYLMLLDQYQRRSKLSPGLAISLEALDNARRQSETASANYQQGIAARDTAALNLKRTEVRASVNGFITNLNLAKGTYASQGQPVMALIDSDSYRVEAYFEETKIPQVKPGAAAEIHLMDGSPALQGTVLGIAMGITDQDNPNGPQLLSSINPTFTWVRLAQRIPVGIHITQVPPGVLVSAGMTCTVVMREGGAPAIGSRLKKVMTAIVGHLRVSAISAGTDQSKPGIAGSDAGPPLISSLGAAETRATCQPRRSATCLSSRIWFSTDWCSVDTCT
jgi:multidrug resistance efflux pump